GTLECNRVLTVARDVDAVALYDDRIVAAGGPNMDTRQFTGYQSQGDAGDRFGSVVLDFIHGVLIRKLEGLSLAVVAQHWDRRRGERSRNLFDGISRSLGIVQRECRDGHALWISTEV